MQSITSGVRAFTGLLVGRVYLIEDADGLSLVDTGLGLTANKIITQLRQLGRSPTDVKRILITHAHPDHVGGLPRRPSQPRPPRILFKPTPVDQAVQDSDVIEALGGLRVVFTPGHALGHIVFWQPERKILFCGDVLFNTPSLRLPFAPLTVDMAENIRSIKQVAQLGAELVCFGHGQPLTQNSAQRLRDFAARL